MSAATSCSGGSSQYSDVPPPAAAAPSLESASLRAAAENLWGQTSKAPAAPVAPHWLSGAQDPQPAPVPQAVGLPSMQAQEADAMRAAAGALWLQTSSCGSNNYPGAAPPAQLPQQMMPPAAQLPYGGYGSNDALSAGTADLLAKINLDASSGIEQQPLHGLPGMLPTI